MGWLVARDGCLPYASDCLPHFQDLAPSVKQLVDNGCCSQLSKLVESFRPASALCVTGTVMPIRYAFGFFHEAANCNGYTRLINGWPDGSSGRCVLIHLLAGNTTTYTGPL
jgi:hypothetical protein